MAVAVGGAAVGVVAVVFVDVSVDSACASVVVGVVASVADNVVVVKVVVAIAADAGAVVVAVVGGGGGVAVVAAVVVDVARVAVATPGCRCCGCRPRSWCVRRCCLWCACWLTACGWSRLPAAVCGCGWPRAAGARLRRGCL